MGRGAAGGARTNFTSKGQDVRYTLEVDFLEAALGATKRVTLPGGGMLDLNVPAAVTDGQVLRLKGKGQRGVGGAEAGDALVEVRVRPHPQFKREDDDILLEVPITIDEAVLGAKVEVPTISGRVQLSIPKGTSSGRVFRLKGKGVKSAGRAEPGDQLVSVKIVLPENIDDTLAYFFSEWRQKNRYDPWPQVARPAPSCAASRDLTRTSLVGAAAFLIALDAPGDLLEATRKAIIEVAKTVDQLLHQFVVCLAAK
ncbi:MAG: J domain-containing protein [Hyphomicrobium sp.]